MTNRGPIAVLKDHLRLFWANDPESQLWIAVIIAAGIAFLVLVYLPLWLRLRRVRGVRGRLHRALRRAKGERTPRDACAEVFKKSFLRDSWEDFLRRWREAEEKSIGRAPVRFASVFDEHPLMPTGWRRALLSSIPGIFLALGIFGTFIGLTLALDSEAHRPQIAAESPERRANANRSDIPASGADPEPAGAGTQGSESDGNPSLESANQRIAHLVSSLGVAFRTSLWGLVLSVSSIILIRRLEGGFEAEEERLDVLVHNAYGWLSEAELSALAFRDQRKATDLLRTELTQATMSLENALSSGLTKIESATSNAASMVSRGLLEELSQVVREGVGAHVEALRDAIERTAATQKEIGDSLARVFDEMRSAAQSHAETATRLKDSASAVGSASEMLSGVARDLTPTVDSLRAASSSLEQTAHAISDTQRAAGEAVESVRATLNEARQALDDQRTLVEGTLAEMRGAIERLSHGLSDDLLNALRNVDGVFAEALGRLSGTIRDSNDMLDRVGPAVRQVLELSQAIQATLANASSSIDGLAPRLLGGLEPIEARLADLVGASDGLRSTVSAITASVEGVAAAVDKWATSIKEQATAADRLRDVLAELAHRTTLAPSSPGTIDERKPNERLVRSNEPPQMPPSSTSPRAELPLKAPADAQPKAGQVPNDRPATSTQPQVAPTSLGSSNEVRHSTSAVVQPRASEASDRSLDAAQPHSDQPQSSPPKGELSQRLEKPVQSEGAHPPRSAQPPESATAPSKSWWKKWLG